MRFVRLLGAVLTILTAGMLLLPAADAQQPAKLTDHITDSTGVLTDSSRAAVSSAIDRLANDRHIQLWVVYVDNFSRFKPDNWADQTRSATGMGDHDALLAIATKTNSTTSFYAFSPPPKLQGITEDELNSLRTKQIEPAVSAKDWSGAAVAAADGLNKATSSPKRNWLPVVIGVVAAVFVIVVLLLLYRRHRRRRAAARVDSSGGQVSIDGPQYSVGEALSTAESRLRQISDYVAQYHDSVGAEAQARLEDAKRYLAAAHGREATNAREAVAYAIGSSRSSAQAQTLANADVLAAHRTPPSRRRGSTSSR